MEGRDICLSAKNTPWNAAARGMRTHRNGIGAKAASCLEREKKSHPVNRNWTRCYLPGDVVDFSAMKSFSCHFHTLSLWLKGQVISLLTYWKPYLEEGRRLVRLERKPGEIPPPSKSMDIFCRIQALISAVSSFDLAKGHLTIMLILQNYLVRTLYRLRGSSEMPHYSNFFSLSPITLCSPAWTLPVIKIQNHSRTNSGHHFALTRSNYQKYGEHPVVINA